MPEPRDRLPRPIDISSLLPNAARRVHLMVDEPGLSLGLLGTPVRGRAQLNPGAALVIPVGRGIWTPAAGRGLRRSTAGRGSVGRRMVTPGRGRGRARSALPSWYRRTPLGDITAIVRAMERRGSLVHVAGVVEVSEQQTEASTPLPTRIKGDPEISPMSPIMMILAKIKNEDGKAKDSTPQKKLLDSIDRVREVWLEEQRKLESTPAAKRAERAKKMKTLMSMR